MPDLMDEELKKVYIVSAMWEGDGSIIEGVFNTRLKAESWCRGNPNKGCAKNVDWDIDEYEVQ
uniref:DUF7336 domain-containing protein n=1 Tax=viral metagenome TaxID=1070528 RepID=A0A6M3LNP8_9ZZZZ